MEAPHHRVEYFQIGLLCEAISALAGLAIAVALVPPVCVVGLLLSNRLWQEAYGASLLFTTNLLGILVGAMGVLGTLEPVYRQRLVRSAVAASYRRASEIPSAVVMMIRACGKVKNTEPMTIPIGP